MVPPLLKSDAGMDLFKPFSYALNKYHKRIKYIFYIFSTGIIEMYFAFLWRAGAIVVVVCNHLNATSVKGNGYNY